MQASREEALSLFQNWYTEQRLIQCTVVMGKMRARVLGRIDNLQQDYMYISAKSLKRAEYDDKFFVDIPFVGATFEYVEAQDAPEPYLQTAIERNFKSLLGVEYESGLKIAIHVYKSEEELQRAL